ncbi:hypothetical protein Poli38472_011747 [Pythium oligandrum]|uniref:BZIP domain-containing protein n=1 Tax=Pythium oligandrum TaxID=41045 RepID=A0A8K1C820_PYTOL|nr:hypothetical protein Poli38472_011747 [Pythium oligandrum]|eukprot:TMW58159.1 hypothetical protein Poli38472_011747 [Pythium oligandrum]
MDPAKPKGKHVRIKTERRREQCRQNQARYRDKKKLYESRLELLVSDLKVQIELLEERRRSLYHSVNLREAPTKIVMEYFRLFERGLSVDSFVLVPYSIPTSRRPQSAHLQEQMEFLMAVMSDNARIGDSYGRDIFIEQNKCFATYYDDLTVHLLALNTISIGPEAMTTIQATLEIKMIITPATLRYVYPHVQSDVTLKEKLLGHRLCCTASGTYHFDERHAITSVHWTIDFALGLMGVLSIEEAGAVLQGARIAHDAYFSSENHDSNPLSASEMTTENG